jgi:hypothetical protein
MRGLNPKFFSYLLLSLLGLSGVLYILFALQVIGEGVMLNWCFMLFGVAALVAVIFPIIGMVKDFQKAKNSLIGVGILIVIFVLGYALSTEETYRVGESIVEGAVSRRAEAGLIAFYVMIVMAIVAIIYTEISKAFK